MANRSYIAINLKSYGIPGRPRLFEVKEMEFVLHEMRYLKQAMKISKILLSHMLHIKIGISPPTSTERGSMLMQQVCPGK